MRPLGTADKNVLCRIKFLIEKAVKCLDIKKQKNIQGNKDFKNQV